jgi:hypothetical protein
MDGSEGTSKREETSTGEDPSALWNGGGAAQTDSPGATPDPVEDYRAPLVLLSADLAARKAVRPP